MNARAQHVADLRPRYRQDLEKGIERFAEPRRTTCPWCDSSDLDQRLRTTDLIQRKPGIFLLDECRDCGHVFQNPRLSEEGLEFYYRDAYDGLGAEITERYFSSRTSTKLYRCRARAVSPFTRPRLWLDVGTGHGHFCAEARKIHPDTEFHGLDQGEGVRTAEREQRVTCAFRGSFPALTDQLADRYDVVSMHHYLEHTRSPREELAAAHTALRPEGHLLIEVPDPDSYYAVLLGRLWVGWLQPQHQHLMPIANLSSALGELGFTVVATDRSEPHMPVDLAGAALGVLESVLPGEDQPWLPERPDAARRWTRTLGYLAAAPALIGLFGLDQALAPLVRRTRLSNAYRIVARRD